MRFFEVKVKYDRVLDNGATKAVTETYAVEALSFTEAEAHITATMLPFVSGDFEVTAEKIAPYTTVKYDKDRLEIFFMCKYTHMVTNETTGIETKKHLETILICAHDFDRAKAVANEYMSGSMADWQIDTLKETKILDVYTDDLEGVKTE